MRAFHQFCGYLELAAFCIAVTNIERWYEAYKYCRAQGDGPLTAFWLGTVVLDWQGNPPWADEPVAEPEEDEQTVGAAR